MTLTRSVTSLAVTAALITGSALIGTEAATAAPVTSLSSGGYTLAIDSQSNSRFGVVISRGQTALDEQRSPLSIRVKTGSGTEAVYSSPYSTWSNNAGTITAAGSVTTPAGSRFDFTDRYRSKDGTGAFAIDREVTVGVANSADKGFASGYSLAPLGSTDLDDYDVFAPGNWYRRNTNVVTGAFASAYSDENFLIKETRLPLPLFMLQERSTGEAATLIHAQAALSSEESESTSSWLVDDGFKFGALGIKKSPRPTLNFIYPSAEGDKNYYGNDQNRNLHLNGMVRRSHPVQTGFRHAYSLIIKLDQQASFQAAQGAAWKYAFSTYQPAVKRIPAETLYANDMAYFDAKFKRFNNGAAGLPFSSRTVETGDTGYHLQSGFVGQQAKVGWQLVRAGYAFSNTQRRQNGEAIIDFWADKSMTAAGIPRTDYFAEDGNWGSDPLFLRTVSDAAEGVLDAYDVAADHGDIHDNWLIYVQKFGDFLLEKQQTDGSWARSYNPDGSVSGAGKFNTTNPVRFLVKLYLATHQQSYLEAARAAGEWSRVNVDQNYNYVGGTPDNDNTIDKEAGMMALNAFNALYDVTGEAKWLVAARNAANYVQSWTYSYDFNVYPSTRWSADGAAYPSWLKVDLGSSQSIERIETMFEFGNAAYRYKIETSPDDSTWITFADKSANSSRPASMGYIDSGNATARYVRISIAGAEGNRWPSIYEFKVYGASGSNLAQGRPATASSTQDARHNAAKAVDGVVTSDPKSPWPSAGQVGQSLVATGHSYSDTFMINGPAEFYRLYLSTGDSQYLQFAKLLANNANAPSDYDGRLGYQYKALLGEGIMGNNFTAYYGLETLTWQLAVQLESIVTLEDLFGYKNIDQIETNLSTAQKETLNHLSVRPAGLPIASVLRDGGVYRIVNRNSGRLLDVQGASTANGANIWQYRDVGGTGQQWRAVDQGAGFWKFVNVKSGKVVDVEGSSKDNGGEISQFDDLGAGAANQQWQVVGVGDGYWKLLNRNSGKAVDVQGSGRNDGQNVSQYTDTGTANQQWAFAEVPQGVTSLADGGVYRIVNRNSGRLLDVQGASTANGANIWQYRDVGGTGQQWRAVDQGAGFWKFVNVKSGKVVDVEGSSKDNGGEISQFDDLGAGAANQQWQVVGVGDGYWKLLNRNSGKAVDVQGSANFDGANVSQYQDRGSANQQWLFNRVP